MHVHLIIVPYDSGVRDRRMGRGPMVLMEAGLSEALVDRGHRVELVRIELPLDVFHAEVSATFRLQRLVSEAVAAAREAQAFPLVLAGNCSTSIGVVTGIRARDGSLPAVCWLDAHADFNTPETSESGFLDGMAVAMLTGRAWRSMTQALPGFHAVPESSVLMVGTRDYDPIEGALLTSSTIRRVAVKEIPSRLDAAFEALRTEAGELYFHLDLDVVDIADGVANSYACPGGLTRSAVLQVLQRAMSSFTLAGLAITAYDPEHGGDARIEELAIAAALRALRATEASTDSAQPGAPR